MEDNSTTSKTYKKKKSQIPKAESLLKDLLTETQTEAEHEKEKIEQTLKQKQDEEKNRKKTAETLVREEFRRKVEEERRKREEQIALAEEKRRLKDLEERQSQEKSEQIVLKTVSPSKKYKKFVLIGSGTGFAVILIIFAVIIITRKEEKDFGINIPSNSVSTVRDSAYSSKPVILSDKTGEKIQISDPAEAILKNPPKQLARNNTENKKAEHIKSTGKVRQTGTKLIQTDIFSNKKIIK
jgi:hypothetical protein